ncbi:hypothetical protein PGAG_00115 [Phaeocystis globosa virus 12T]|uniref:Uncharacterized protein n=1 Tax=Phaeocystis globosa virus PgV-16T TaxID=3071227 RepID=A0AC59EWZ2_9VIRU|nr:hypothetical protein PGCG_00156 [Phaeocystis globosa virus]AET73004.1 hypothetical protein PGAG_00115 [Phaeocystis globosa virus 12T]AET73826.1 hypothetical protein PGBG_00118 [Phaeocystis globosa virus 14T]AGM15467.1 hypothetical protein PGCG_00156 [Phaeocystis globosa virus PgV-16T]UYE94197.1 HNH endonuclease [Phaeocystis globosa virus]
MNNTTEMKPKYVMNEALKEYKIIYGNRTYIFNSELYYKIFNYDKGFKIYNIDDDYPAYKNNNKYFNLLDFAYGVKKEDFNFKFVNGNKYDLRDENVILENIGFETALKGFDVIKHIYKGTLVDGGKYSREIKNPICEILNEKNEIEYLMLCNQDILCKMCPRSYQAIRDFEKKHNYERPIIWTYQGSKHILGNNNLYIHQVIKDCCGNETTEIRIDHKDLNTLNNRFDNLYIHQVIKDCCGNETTEIGIDHEDLNTLNNRFDNLYIHQVIKDCCGNETTEIGIDHEDLNTLNNRFDNLYIHQVIKDCCGNEKNEVEYLMFCNQGKLCPLSYQAIRDFEKKHNYDRPINWTYNEKTR